MATHRVNRWGMVRERVKDEGQRTTFRERGVPGDL